MKSDFVQILKCPNCNSSDFGISTVEKKNSEIRHGCLLCRNCQVKFDIKEGIVDLLFNPPPEIINQQKSIFEADKDSKSEGAGFEVNARNILLYRKQFLSLPEGDGSRLYKKGAFRNVSSLSERYYTFIKKLKLTGREKLLELGADSCWSVNKFAQLGCSCVALDINHHLIVSDLYMEENNVFFERVIADMSSLPFKDSSFDVVFCSLSLHHSLNLKNALCEIYRVLKPGGKLGLFSEPVLGILFFWQKAFFGIKARKLGICERIYTLSEWLKFLRSAGFEPELYFSFYQRYKSIRNCFFLFKNAIVKQLFLKSYLYPLLILKPFKVDIVAYKCSSKV